MGIPPAVEIPAAGYIFDPDIHSAGIADLPVNDNNFAMITIVQQPSGQHIHGIKKISGFDGGFPQFPFELPAHFVETPHPVKQKPYLYPLRGLAQQDIPDSFAELIGPVNIHLQVNGVPSSFQIGKQVFYKFLPFIICLYLIVQGYNGIAGPEGKVDRFGNIIIHGVPVVSEKIHLLFQNRAKKGLKGFFRKKLHYLAFLPVYPPQNVHTRPT